MKAQTDNIFARIWNNRESRKKFMVLLTLGLVIRALLMPFTFVPDLIFIYQSSYLMVSEGVTNIYQYLYDNDRCWWGAVGACYGYSPLTYFTFGIYEYALDHNTQFHTWMENNKKISPPGVERDGFIETPAGEENQLIPLRVIDFKPYVSLFLMKSIYLFFEILTVFFFIQLFDSVPAAIKAFKLWILCPIVIFSTYVVGEFDIITVFFVVMALYLLKKNHDSWALFSLGIAAAYKYYPFFLMVPVIISLDKRLLARIKLAIVGFIPFVASIIPFIGTPAFITGFLKVSTRSGNIPYEIKLVINLLLKYFGNSLGINSLNSSGWFHFINYLSPFLVCYGLFVLYVLFNKNANREKIPYYMLFVFLILYLTMDTFIHYLLWFIPVLIYLFVTEKLDERIFWMLATFEVIIKTIFVRHLSNLVFSPINPDFFAGLPMLQDLLGKIGSYLVYVPLYLICTAIFIYLGYILLRKFESERRRQQETSH